MMRNALSHHDVVQIARDLYSGASLNIKLFQTARPLICPFEDLVPWVPEAGKMLDIGCGAGLFLGLAANLRPDLHAVGFDVNADVIREAQAMANRQGLTDRVTFEICRPEDPYPNGPFSAVSMIDVLHHIHPAFQRKAIVDAGASLSSGGVMIYKDMAQKPTFSALWNRFHDLVLARQWIHYRPIEEVESWLIEDGIEVIDRSAKSTGPYRHEWLIGRRLR
jgi:cyclopropane fatty-acyl-phospholipid synthase-like methyltransferase